jgi:hypothetical protein
MPSQHSAMTPDLFKRCRGKMFKKLIGAAAMAALAYAVVPASGAKTAGCSGENLEKTEATTEAMADGAGKVTAHKEIRLAQEALLGEKMGACAMHLAKAMQAGGMNQASYQGSMNQVPAETTAQAPNQTQWNWKPIKPLGCKSRYAAAMR